VRPIEFPRYHDANHFKQVPPEPSIQRVSGRVVLVPAAPYQRLDVIGARFFLTLVVTNIYNDLGLVMTDDRQAKFTNPQILNVHGIIMKSTERHTAETQITDSADYNLGCRRLVILRLVTQLKCFFFFLLQNNIHFGARGVNDSRLGDKNLQQGRRKNPLFIKHN
jgi:hypothetical protein